MRCRCSRGATAVRRTFGYLFWDGVRDEVVDATINWRGPGSTGEADKVYFRFLRGRGGKNRRKKDLIVGLADFGDTTALIVFSAEGTIEVTFAEVLHPSRRLAAWLVDRGIERGCPVGILAPNGNNAVVCCLA